MYKDHPDTFAPVEIHPWDMDPNLKCADGIPRATYYNVSLTPTAAFDGVVTNQPYTAWKGIFDNCVAGKSPLDIALTVTLNGNNFTATVKVTRGGDVANTNLKLRFAVTEDGLAGNNLTFNNVMRKMYPDANGTAITLPAAAATEFEINGALNAAWKKNKLNYIAWVQEDTTKKVYQAKLITAAEVTSLESPAMSGVDAVYR